MSGWEAMQQGALDPFFPTPDPAAEWSHENCNRSGWVGAGEPCPICEREARFKRADLAPLIAEAYAEQEWLLKQKQHHIEVRERLKWVRRFIRVAEQSRDDALSLALLIGKHPRKPGEDTVALHD